MGTNETTRNTLDDAGAGRQWFIVGRWQEYEGEGRANLVRIAALVAFYAVQLVDHHFFQVRTDDERQYHQAVTAIAAGWTLMGLLVQTSLRRQVFPAALKYVSTAGDLTFLTVLLWIGSGPASPLIYAYFPVVALSGLRFNLRLVRFATLGAMGCYLAVVGASDPHWFDSQHATPVVQQLVALLSIGLTGLIVGQVVRRVRGLAADYARRLQTASGARS